MDGFTALAKAISELGISVVCGAFVIWFAIYQVKKDKIDQEQRQKQELENLKLKQEEDIKKDELIKQQYTGLINQLQEQNEKLLEQQNKNNNDMMNQIIYQVNSHVPSAEEDKNLSLLNNTINAYLNDLLKKIDASRVNLVQYHNGARNLNRMSFLKMSVTNEQVKVGCKPLMPEFKDQFRSVLSYVVSELDEKGYCFIKNPEDVKEKDAGTYEFLINRNIKSKYTIAIKNDEETVIGFLCVEYENKPTESTEEIKKNLEKYKERIQTLLNLEKDKSYVKQNKEI